LCVLNRQPTWAKITRTGHGIGHRAESKDQRVDMCTDGLPRTSSTDVLCLLTDNHGLPVCAGRHQRTQPTWAKITRTVHGKGQHAESKDQRADMCTDGQPRTSSTDILYLLTDNHGQPRTSFHWKGQRAESKEQRGDMCTDGQPRTSCVC
ncbi:unnamed protein product, partial [Brassica rapa]